MKCCPFMTDGGSQLLLVCGVVILRVALRFVCRNSILQDKKKKDGKSKLEEGDMQVDKTDEAKRGIHTGDRSDNGDFFGDLFTLKVLLQITQNIDIPESLRAFITQLCITTKNCVNSQM